MKAFKLPDGEGLRSKFLVETTWLDVDGSIVFHARPKDMTRKKIRRKKGIIQEIQLHR